jgi:asparagine synthase (glutamine-hydrolysing)
MCGILGGNNFIWDYENALNSMKHRGPDSSRIIKKNDFVLGFNRLAVIDVSDNSMQPMFTDNGQIGLVFNGEIYEYGKIRDCLVNKGYKFKSNGDTEVLLYAYIEWGDDFVNHVEGMYAIAIYDQRIQEIHLFRDKVGIKPLYYFFDGRSFAFASELKGILSLCNNHNFQYDNTAIYDYLYYQYIPDPKTLYEKVYKLEPATELKFDINKNEIVYKRKFWTVCINPYKSGKVDIDEISWNVRNLISNSVKKQLVADVPLGTFLSGGIDSSVVTYEAKTIGKEIEAFCMGFSGDEYDETPYACEVANSIGIKLNNYMLYKDDFKNNYKHIKEWFDEPFGDSTAVANYLLSRSIRDKVTVALSGDGGDEVFGGYKRYEFFANLDNDKYEDRVLSALNNKLKIYRLSSVLDLGKKGDVVGEYACLSGFSMEEHAKLYDKEIRKKLNISKLYDPLWFLRKFYVEDLPRISMAQYIDFHTYLSSCMMPKVDRTSMAVSLEVRVPLLDEKLVKYVFSLPEDVRCTKLNLKKILKDAYEGLLPNDILYRKKKGFTIPKDLMFRDGKDYKETLIKKLWGIRII